MTENAYAYSLGPASLGPFCDDCGPRFVEEMSEDRPFLCLDCAEACELRERAAQQAQDASEFRYASRYWLAVRPVLSKPLHELVDELDQAQARARFLLGERYYDATTRVDLDAPATSHDRDSRALGSR